MVKIEAIESQLKARDSAATTSRIKLKGYQELNAGIMVALVCLDD